MCSDFGFFTRSGHPCARRMDSTIAMAFSLNQIALTLGIDTLVVLVFFFWIFSLKAILSYVPSLAAYALRIDLRFGRLAVFSCVDYLVFVTTIVSFCSRDFYACPSFA